ncbi:hypothetical protein [Serratia symbiotica]
MKLMRRQALPERCPFRGLFIPNPIYSTKPSFSYTPVRTERHQ